MNGNDRDASTVVLRVFLFRIFPLMLLKLNSACYFEIARETMLLSIRIDHTSTLLQNIIALALSVPR